MKNNLSIVIATLNEAKNVELLFNLIQKHLDEKLLWELIFVDDESTDGTIEKIENIIKKQSNVKLIKRTNTRGLSSALIQGTLLSDAKYILFMDSDLQHEPKYILDMYNKIIEKKLDIVSASRFTNNEITNLSNKRYKASIFVNKMINKIFKINMLDALTGYFIIEKNFFDKSIKKLSKKGFKLLLDIVLTNKKNINKEEMPFIFKKRYSGTSKLDNKIIIDFIYLIIDKLIGQILPTRYVMYSFVGSLGVLVQLIFFYIFYNKLNFNFSIATIMGIFVAMNFNYNLNNIFTYSDIRLRGKNYIKGMFLFYFFCSLGAIYNFLSSRILFEFINIELLSVFIGAVVGSIWNYSMNTSFNWKDT